jgi:hypothetical protein
MIKNITDVCEEADRIFDERFPDNLKNIIDDDDDQYN